MKQVRDRPSVSMISPRLTKSIPVPKTGKAALANLEDERRVIMIEDRAFTPDLRSNSAALAQELERQRSGKFGQARQSEMETLQRVMKREKKEF